MTRDENKSSSFLVLSSTNPVGGFELFQLYELVAENLVSVFVDLESADSNEFAVQSEDQSLVLVAVVVCDVGFEVDGASKGSNGSIGSSSKSFQLLSSKSAQPPPFPDVSLLSLPNDSIFSSFCIGADDVPLGFGFDKDDNEDDDASINELFLN